MTHESSSPAVLSWSGGKDSCLALAQLLQDGTHVASLLTTITRDFDRISMHGVRRSLLQAQAAALGLPLYEAFIPKSASNGQYELAMGEAFGHFRSKGVTKIAFGDLFLEEIRAYREQLLSRYGMTGVYPIWQRNTAALIREFIERGFKTIVVCVDPAKLDPSFAGRIIDADFLAELPGSVDPCGENGEFHTFVFEGPLFRAPVKFAVGELVLRDGFWFRDLLPA
jgi:uncharacterized protein (TIGR00290 family)